MHRVFIYVCIYICIISSSYQLTVRTNLNDERWLHKVNQNTNSF